MYHLHVGIFDKTNINYKTYVIYSVDNICLYLIGNFKLKRMIYTYVRMFIPRNVFICGLYLYYIYA